MSCIAASTACATISFRLRPSEMYYPKFLLSIVTYLGKEGIINYPVVFSGGLTIGIKIPLLFSCVVIGGVGVCCIPYIF